MFDFIFSLEFLIIAGVLAIFIYAFVLSHRSAPPSQSGDEVTFLYEDQPQHGLLPTGVTPTSETCFGDVISDSHAATMYSLSHNKGDAIHSLEED